MAPVYRDHQHALRQRLDDVLQRAARRVDQLTPAFWRTLSEEQRRSLHALRASAHEEARAIPERLAAAERYAASIEAALVNAVARASHEEQAPAHCPAPQPDAPTFPLGELFGAGRLRDESALAQLRARVVSICRRIDGGHTLDDFGTRGVWASLRVDQAPFAVTATLGGGPRWSAGGVTEVALRVRTSVGPRAGLLRLSPRADSLHWLAFLSRRHASPTGDDTFDGWFDIDAEPGAARAMLCPEVRAALCVVARDDAPTLEVAGGVAELRWRFEPSHGTVRAAIDALRLLRDAPPMPLLREPSRRSSSR